MSHKWILSVRKLLVLYIVFCTVLCVVPFDAYSETSTKHHMRDVLSSYIKIIPYAYNGKDLRDKKFMQYMQEFEKSLDSSAHAAFLKNSNFGPNLKIIKDSVSQFKESTKMKNYYFAKNGLKTIAAKCVSCHSQLPKNSYGKINGKYNAVIDTEVKSLYDRAMMSYLLRDYPSAIKRFSGAIKEYQSEPQIQDRSIRKIIKIAYMNNIGTKDLVDRLSGFKSLIKKPSYLYESLEAWIKQVKTFKAVPTKTKIDTAVKKLLIPIENEMKSGDPDQFRVQLHYMQGLLSQSMSMDPTGKNKLQSPMPLYWLGLIENAFHEDFMFSLGDMYLKNCIETFPKSKYAKKCYKAIEESYIFGFTGSMGTHLPEDVKAELKILKEKVGITKDE